MINCPNYVDVSSHVAKCSIIEQSGIQYIPSERRSGCPCHTCLKQQNGLTPTIDNPTQAIKDYIKTGMSYPTVLEQAKTFGQSILRNIFRGFPIVPSGEFDVRIKTCEANKCDMFDAEQRRCKGCGCYIDEKAKYNGEDCPAQLWPKLPLEVINNVPSRCGSCSGKR